MKTILVVEDEDALRGLACLILNHHGYRVLGARDGPEALLVCAQHQGPVHLLITDVSLPHMSGQLLADALLRQRPGVKVLFISGHTDEVLGPRGVLAPGIEFLMKPFTLAVLVRKVEEMLERGPDDPVKDDNGKELDQ